MSTLYDVLKEHQQHKDDKRTFGLVVQGGGMRAVYSAAALATLLAYDFGDVFDHVIGSSAGGINGAYFLAGDPETRLTYTEDLTNRKFVNLTRPNKIVDIDYLVDTVLEHKRPLDLDHLRQATSKLHILMTNAKTGKSEDINKHHDFADIYEEFRATAALPVLYDKVVQVGKKRYIDGGVSDLIPIDVAYKLGCTDIVLIMTQKIDSYHFDRRHDRLVKHLMRHFARHYSSAIRALLPTNEKLLRRNLRQIIHPLRKVRVYVLQPSNEEELISLATTDKPKVEALARLGIADMDVFLHEQLI